MATRMTMMDRVFEVIYSGDPGVGVVRADIEETLGITTSQARTALRSLKAKKRIRIDRFDPETMEACYVPMLDEGDGERDG